MTLDEQKEALRSTCATLQRKLEELERKIERDKKQCERIYRDIDKLNSALRVLERLNKTDNE